MESIFGTNRFNVIEDEENYYYFRALEPGDFEDIESGVITSSDGKYTRLRTDRERWEEQHEGKTPKYNSECEISLEEMYHHIKMRYSLQTNCISLSSNAGVAVTYGGETPKFVMVKVPKTNEAPCYNAVEYMYEEMNHRVEEALLQANEEVRAQIKEIDSLEDSSSVRERTFQAYRLKAIQEDETQKRYEAKRLGTRESVFTRFNRNEMLSPEQQLAKDKLMAKITLLEANGALGSMISSCKDNVNLIRTFNSAVSSVEQIYYGDIPGGVEGAVVPISRTVLDMFSLIQQVKESEKEIDTEALKLLEKQVIEYAREGYDVKTQEGRVVFSNGPKALEFAGSEDSVLERQDEIKLKADLSDDSQDDSEEEMSIEKMYELTGGSVSYERARLIVRATYYVSKSKRKVEEITSILKSGIEELEISNEERERLEDLIETIKEKTYTIEPEIVQRKNNRGHRISESVRFDVNGSRKIIKENELREVLDIIDALTEEEKEQILISGGIGLGEKIVPAISKEENAEKNTYYAKAIVDAYDWKEIGITFTEFQKDEFIRRIKRYDVVSIYENLKRLNVAEKQIPAVILNLCTQGIHEELLNSLSTVTEISTEQLENLEKKLSIETVEAFMGFFKVEGTDIELKEYQQRVSDSIDEIYQDHNFAMIVMPTGSGKTYMIMAELLKEKYELRNKESKKKILCLAPTNEILLRTRAALIENLVGRAGTTGKEDEKIITEEFPNLEFMTFAKLLTLSEEELKKQYELIIADEFHGLGGHETEKKIRELLSNQGENTKVLGATATPVRDSDERNMADVFAEFLGYTEEEIKAGKHIAQPSMNVVDAIRAGIVVNPRVVSCDYIIRESDRFRNLAEEIEKIKDEKVRERFQREYGEYKRNLDKAEGIDTILSNNIRPGGKYIIFISPGETYDEDVDDEMEEDANSRGVSERKIEKIKKKFQEEWLAEYSEIHGIKLEFNSMLGVYGDRENERQLKAFEADSDDKTVKFMVVINKLEQGVHVKGVNGIIWTRPLHSDSARLLLQHIGRCIFPIDDKKTLSEEEIPVIIDLPNNLVNVDINKKINTYSRRDDFKILQEIVNWIEYHNGIFPDINGTGKEEERKAIQLKRIQEKYLMYKNFFNEDGSLKDEQNTQTKDEIEKIYQIIELGKQIELWEMELPEKLDKDGNIIPIEKISDINTFKLEGMLRNLVELEDKVKDTCLKENEEEIRALKERLIALGIPDEMIEEKAEKNLVMAEKIVEGYNFGRKLSNEEKKAIICAVLNNRKLNKSNNIYISNLIENLRGIGLSEQEAYGSIINMAILGSAVKKGGYDYSSLLRSSKKVQELKVSEIDTIVTEGAIKVAQAKLEKQIRNESLSDEEIHEVKERLKVLSIPDKMIEEKDERNLAMAKKIVEEYNFGRKLSNEEERAIIHAVLKQKELNKSGSGYISNLIENLRGIGLGKQEVYGSIINMAIKGNAGKTVRYSYSDLFHSSKKVQELQASEIDTNVTEDTIKEAQTKLEKQIRNENLSDEEIHKVKERLRVLGIPDEMIEEKAERNLVMAEKIVEGYNFGRKLSNEEKKAIICAVLKPKKLNKSVSIYISKLSGNLSSLGLDKQEVYGSIINMAIKGNAGKNVKYIYSDLLASSKRVRELQLEEIDTIVTEGTIKAAQTKLERKAKKAKRITHQVLVEQKEDCGFAQNYEVASIFDSTIKRAEHMTSQESVQEEQPMDGEELD